MLFDDYIQRSNTSQPSLTYEGALIGSSHIDKPQSESNEEKSIAKTKRRAFDQWTERPG
jgi:hypothetical protein